MYHVQSFMAWNMKLCPHQMQRNLYFYPSKTNQLKKYILKLIVEWRVGAPLTYFDALSATQKTSTFLCTVLEKMAQTYLYWASLSKFFKDIFKKIYISQLFQEWYIGKSILCCYALVALLLYNVSSFATEWFCLFFPYGW